METLRQEAYDAYLRDLVSAWQSGPREGDPGTLNAAPAHWCYVNGRLQPVPDDECNDNRVRLNGGESNKQFNLANPSADSMSDAQSIKDAAYAEYQEELENRWRGNK